MKRPFALLALLVLALSCARGDRGAATPSPSAPPASERRQAVPVPGPRPRIALIVLENKEYDSIVGNRSAPYINALARRWALATSFYATAHPSLPNYLAMIGGDTFAITSDCTTCRVAAPNLTDQLDGAGITWKAYMESMPSPCFRGGSSGYYAKKHNPFLYFETVAGDRDRCARVVPLGRLQDDLLARTLPTFIWITPNLCHDMHDCSIARGDGFLAGLVPTLLAALGPRGVLFLTFDEGTTRRGCCSFAAGGRIVTIAAGPGVRPGTYDAPLDHYSLLRAIEDRWSLARLGKAGAAQTPSLDAMLR